LIEVKVSQYMVEVEVEVGQYLVEVEVGQYTTDEYIICKKCSRYNS